MGWALRRKYRMGNTLGRIALLHRTGRLRRAAVGCASVSVGTLKLLSIGLLSRRKRAGALVAVARGAGMLSAFAGVAFEEYAPASGSSSVGKYRA